MTNIHFEELWEKSENSHKENSGDVPSILEALKLKIELYSIIDSKSELSKEDRQKAKSRIYGEILHTLTHVSLIDNVNVYEALGIALYYHDINTFQQKY